MPNRNLADRPPHFSTYPFTAIVGQDEMKLALVLNAVDPLLGGVLIMGHRGTGKSTAVRSLAYLLPEIRVVQDCPYRCDPADHSNACADCLEKNRKHVKRRVQKSHVRMVDLPLGATEDRVCGTIDIERALKNGVRAFEPGLLARANRGLLYIDEVNLLEDHLVDLLLDVAVTGINRVERESISIEHPARFVLVGSGNPEEGELRPQLLDRFALSVDVTTENDVSQRVEVVERHEAAERDSLKFFDRFHKEETRLRRRISRGRTVFSSVTIDREILKKIAQLCSELRLDGHRGEITIARAARALAALEGRRKVKLDDVKRVAPMSLRHRLRREPFEESSGGNSRIEQAVEKVFEQKPNISGRSRDEDDISGNGKRESPDGHRNAIASKQAQTDAAASAFKKVELPELDSRARRTRPNSNSISRNRSSKRDSAAEGGRYSRATINPRKSVKLALDATLRAIVGTPALATPEHSFPTDALRYKQFTRRAGSLYILTIDTSGSMAARRIDRAREVASSLLRRAYIHRDSVAIVVFRGTTAEEVLPPSRSILRAKRALDSLSIGGGTPLSAGVSSALELVKRARATHGEPILLLFTDGGANVPLSGKPDSQRAKRSTLVANELTKLGSELKRAGINSVVIGTGNQFTNDNAHAVAERLGAQYIGWTF
jgi:magnesium chelatase subunit D